MPTILHTDNIHLRLENNMGNWCDGVVNGYQHEQAPLFDTDDWIHIPPPTFTEDTPLDNPPRLYILASVWADMPPELRARDEERYEIVLVPAEVPEDDNTD